MKKLKSDFYARDPDIVAKELLGKILLRKLGNKVLKARICETEAYFGEDDPASWARFGKRKDNLHMWDEPGTMLIKNVHKYLMLNIVTGKKDHASAVLIRNAIPLNFQAKVGGPGLLTIALNIDRSLAGKNIVGNKELSIVDDGLVPEEIITSKRIGVTNDLESHMRFVSPYFSNN